MDSSRIEVLDDVMCDILKKKCPLECLIKKLKISKSKTANFASPEDVVLKKMEYYQKGGSDKHLRDIASMLKISGEDIDRVYISVWAGKLDITEIWHAIQKKVSL